MTPGTSPATPATPDAEPTPEQVLARVVASEGLSEVLSEFARTMLTDFPIQAILDHLVKRIVDIMPITAAGVTLISPTLEPRYVSASSDSALRFEMLQTELGEGPCLSAYQTGAAVLVPDLRGERRFPVFAPRAVEAGMAAVFTFPLRHETLQLGALDLYRGSAGALSPESLTAAQTLADVAAAYLINAQARTDLQDSSDRSREAALHDALTGLPNRVLMLERLEHAFQRGRRSGRTSAVFFVDLDRFKQVNDTYGHRVGDELLVAVAERLTAVLRPGDSLARLAGDEFVILCEDLDDVSQADTIASRVDAELARPFTLSEVELQISASVGLAFSGRGGDAAEELLHNADLAMYRTKRDRAESDTAGGPHELHVVGRRTDLSLGLRGVTERDELHIDYQPIVDALDGRLTGVEALLRWNHPGRGSVPPAVFIPYAEQSGEIIEMGQWVLEHAWSERARLQRRRQADIAMSVNVSAHQFMAGGFTDSVAAVLASAPSDPGLLTLEVTENVFLGDGPRALVVLEELKQLGVKLALDDFGTGYSSLSYLNTLPVDAIKIDRAFIGTLSDEPDTHTVVGAIIELAHGLGMTIVAEGVETAEQHHQLTQLGSDSCQGFYFARPMRASSLDALLGPLGDGHSPRLPALAAA